MINLKTFIKLLSTILLLSLIFSFLPAANVHADNGETPFYIDVWTIKGGEGTSTPGGTYYVGEEVILFIGTTRDCKATLIVYGNRIIDYFGGIRDLTAGPYEISLGLAEEVDIGSWTATFQAAAFNEGQRIDSVTFEIVSAPASGPIPVPQTPPSSQQSPPEMPGSDKPVNTLNPEDASEVLALAALKMVEGKIPADPEMDVDKDGQVTENDARLILKWAIKGQESEPSQSDQQDESSNLPEIQIAPPDKDDDQVIIPDSTEADTQAMIGKWEMTRQSIQPPMPDMMPGFLVNLIIPSKSTWTIKGVDNDLTIKYDGRDTWYKKLLLGKGITEGSTTAVVSNQGKSCTFKTPVKFYWESLPFPLNLIASDIKEIKGSFTDSVNVSVSGNNISATVTIGNVQGTFMETDKSGKSVNKQIHYNSTIIYKGTKK